MFCSSCGKELKDGVKFCRHCGKELNEGVKFCRHCGKELNEGVMFCRHCGVELRKPTHNYSHFTNTEEQIINDNMSVSSEKQDVAYDYPDNEIIQPSSPPSVLSHDSNITEEPLHEGHSSESFQEGDEKGDKGGTLDWRIVLSMAIATVAVIALICVLLFKGSRDNNDILEKDETASESSSHLEEAEQEKEKTDQTTRQDNVVSDKTTRDEIKKDWRSVYTEILADVDPEQYAGFSFIYVNSDDVPELVLHGKSEADGNLFLTFYNGTVDELQTARLGFDFIERKNLLCNSDGHMDFYFDRVYSIESGKWKQVADGEYSVSYGTAGTPPAYSLKWNSVTISAQQYIHNLQDIFDIAQASRPVMSSWYSVRGALKNKREVESVIEPSYEPDDKGIHRYQFVVADVSWDQALTACERMGGHLVRINTREEYNYLMAEILRNNMQNKVIWISAARNNYGSYSWYYETGKPYAMEDDLLYGPMKDFWLSGEPSNVWNVGGRMHTEWCVNLIYDARRNALSFNDAPYDIISLVPQYSGSVAFVCEFEN